MFHRLNLRKKCQKHLTRDDMSNRFAHLNLGLCDGLETARLDFALDSYCSLVRRL